MIVVKLKGGLGNQMFQYAFGKRLSLQLNKELQLDATFFAEHPGTPGITPRRFELDVFTLPEKPITLTSRFGFGPAFPYRLNRLADAWLKKTRKEITLTDGNAERDLSAYNTLILDGYFQKERYFIAEEKAIRQAFTFKEKPEGENAGLMELITQCNSVSIHVRRGDYLTDQKTNHYHGVCGVDYYLAAVGVLRSSFPDLHFFVFSDDIAWCQQQLGLNENTSFITHNTGEKSYRDLQLMSACRHHIIANSSFSWWGAWLGSAANKQVVAPKKWFASETINTEGLYPPNWLKL